MRDKQNERIIISALIAILITVFIIVFSEDAFNAALEGLKVWWDVVFPSLLPFFIIAEILMGLGVVHFMGALLEPLMQPLFKVPGVGAFAMAMGLASGYPIGAKITGNLRRKNLCTKTEGERLVSFTNTADPLFMIGAVAVGMFHKAELGIIIAAAHYISSIIIGILLRFYKGTEGKIQNTRYKNNHRSRRKNIFSYAVTELIAAKKNDGRTFGELLGDSIKESINTLFLVGGFIILFSVVTRIFIVTSFLDAIGGLIIILLRPLGLTEAMILPLISGFFEITNGSNLASQAQAPLIHQLIIANAIIAWSGLSVHAQVATMVNGTDISLKPYFFSRILQGILAAILTIFIFTFSGERIETTFAPFVQGFNIHNGWLFTLIIFVGIIICSLVIALLLNILKKIKIIFFHFHG
ncbi:sporulation integral membrane protein YlbJ [Iocasia frigidifontis]|uniref:Sporulation integral membrane protein YlbJ n=1 Tax=Iocasia fonsfrigidae TaxID=2682810 RepID=A0A8A7K9N4_9FIRM|nr:sporulation integral membrane protein YlbJ [Iocasia fonsfrigidae]QTL98171.1 sporulation integral membrane protein YlbJ [Iocasia fonsfrigidae]